MFSLMNSRLIRVFQKCLNCSLGFISLEALFAFACNARTFAITIQFFFNLLVQFFGQTAKSFFWERFIIRYPGTV